MFTDWCLMPYVHHGDVAQCLLKVNHDGDCATANERRITAMHAAIADLDPAPKRYGGSV